jgi:hypothetical protein
MKISVECYSGYRGEETPRAVFMGSRKIEVLDILDQWLSPDHRYFKIRGSDQSIYIIRNDSITLEWTLTYYMQENPVAGSMQND